MGGRPAGSYYIPRLRSLLEELDFDGSSRGLKDARDAGNGLSVAGPGNTWIETRAFGPDLKLWDYDPTTQVYQIINFHRIQKKLTPLPRTEAIVRFDHRIRNLNSFLAKAADLTQSTVFDLTSSIAIAANLHANVVDQLRQDCLCPRPICEKVIAAVHAVVKIPSDEIWADQVDHPSARNPPVRGQDALTVVLNELRRR